VIRSLLIFCLISAASFGQNNLRFTHYTTRDGLSDNIVNALFQDSRGLLWIGTSNGMNYFDGVSFQQIYPTDFDKAHLHSDEVTQLNEDADGNILLTTDDGIEEYNWKAKTLRLIFPAHLNNGIGDLIIDKQKNIWLLTEKYLQQYDPHFKLLRNIRLDTLKNKMSDKAGITGWFFSVDKVGSIWFIYHGITCEWDTLKHLLESRYNNVFHKKIFEINGITGLVQDKRECYWMMIVSETIPNVLACYNWKTDSCSVYHSKSILYFPVIVSSSGKIWINTYNNGLVIFDPIHHLFQAITFNEAGIDTASVSHFKALCEDKNGNIWLANNGLTKCTDLSNNFTATDKFGYDDPQTHTRTSINYITAFKKDLFVSTTDGLFKINTQDLAAQYFKFNNKKQVAEDFNWLSFTINDSLLVAATSKGVFQYNIKNKQLQPTGLSLKHPALLDSIPIVAEFQDSKKNTWLGMLGGNGVYCWNRKNNAFTKYDANQTGKYYFPLRHFSYAAEDDDGNIWMGYDKGGMAFFDAASQKFMQPSLAAFTVLKNHIIHDMLNDHHGNLWISTSQGLFCYTLKAHQLKEYNRADGLISNFVTGIAFDKKGMLWMGTYSGLSRLDTSTKQFTNFTTADGLPADRVFNVVYDSAINKICCVTDYDVVWFDPYTLKKASVPFSPVVTSFNVMGRQESVSDSIHLSYKESFFSFNYTTPDLGNAADMRYQYKLEGFNETWVNAGKRQYAGYTNLDGGIYAFRVRSSADGIRWHEMTTPIAIDITSPFYKTVWFYVMASAIIISIIFLFVYSGYRAKLKRMMTALKIRNEIAGDLHDDVGSSLSSIMLMSEIAKKQDEPQLYFDRIKENAGKIIENMNDIVWAVNPNNDTIELLFIRMQSFASSLLEKKEIEFKFIADDALAAVKLTMEERKNFYLIFKEAIHNAFKYSGCKTVTAEISSILKNVSMNIRDDGQGFDITRSYLGNGLNNMQKRANEINGKLEILSSVNEGTIVTLRFTPTHKGS
jgi:signal transduction histidine kinase/ligand-binding sensor domain-containing protein